MAGQRYEANRGSRVDQIRAALEDSFGVRQWEVDVEELGDVLDEKLVGKVIGLRISKWVEICNPAEVHKPVRFSRIGFEIGQAECVSVNLSDEKSGQPKLVVACETTRYAWEDKFDWYSVWRVGEGFVRVDGGEWSVEFVIGEGE